MNKQKFIEGIERVRNASNLVNGFGKVYHKYRYGLCEHIERNLSYFARLHFRELFSNERVWYWSLDDNGYSQRDMALDIFEQNVLCYETYKEW